MPPHGRNIRTFEFCPNVLFETVGTIKHYEGNIEAILKHYPSIIQTSPTPYEHTPKPVTSVMAWSGDGRFCVFFFNILDPNSSRQGVAPPAFDESCDLSLKELGS